MIASLDAWIFARRHSAIDSVWVRGVRRVSADVIAAGDEVRQRFASVMRRLVASGSRNDLLALPAGLQVTHGVIPVPRRWNVA